MKYINISEKELEKVNVIFNTMNEISNIANDSYIKPMMQRYHFIAKITNYSHETIRKILNGTRTYTYYKKGKYSFKIFYYDSNIYLNRINNKRNENTKTKKQREIEKHYQVARFVRKIAKSTWNKTSAKTLSKLINEKFNKYYSPKHIYWLIKNGRWYGVTLRIFPYLKYGKYQKRPILLTKRFITTPIHERLKIINDRGRYGDVEIDTVEGCKGDSKYLSTMIDRKSRRLSISLYEQKTSTEFLKAVRNNLKKMPTKVKSITSDNGLENSRLNLLNIKWYATNAYSSWQKGTIEQKHKQLRKFIPKGKSLNKLNQEMCDLISLVINAETYLQNPSKYKLGYIINKQELEKYYELINRKEPHPIFKLW